MADTPGLYRHPESEEQRNANITIGSFVVRTAEYHRAAGIPIPEPTASAGHLFVVPPLRVEDLGALGDFLMNLGSIDDGGLRRHAFADSRHGDVVAHDVDPRNIIAEWG